MTAPQEPTARQRAGAYGLGLGALFFLSGALGLLYEIVWFRRLHLALGVSLFAVGAVVSAYMLGLAVGSRWAARSAWLPRAPLIAYAGLELGRPPRPRGAGGEAERDVRRAVFPSNGGSR